LSLASSWTNRQAFVGYAGAVSKAWARPSVIFHLSFVI
jgi:hypothetical protein